MWMKINQKMAGQVSTAVFLWENNTTMDKYADQLVNDIKEAKIATVDVTPG